SRAFHHYDPAVTASARTRSGQSPGALWPQPVTEGKDAMIELPVSSPPSRIWPGSSWRSTAAHRLREASMAFARLGEREGGDQTEQYHRVVSAMHALCARIAQCEQEGWAPEEILAQIAPARKLHGRSPFVSRLQSWPRGYPGDFETIEYLCEGRNRALPGTIE